MKIEPYTAASQRYVIRRGAQYFQCFDADAALWISTPYLAHQFVRKEDAESALAEIRRQSAEQARRRRKAKA